MRNKNFSRTLLAMAIFIVVATLLGIGATPIEAYQVDVETMKFWMSIESSVRYFFAAAIAAVVARKSFLIPAVSLAASVWIVTTWILYRIGQPAGAGLVEVAQSQLLGLLLLILAVIAGSLVGRWFYKREIAAVAVTV